MDRRSAAAHARAIKSCKSDPGCDYPACKVVIGRCWLESEIVAEMRKPVALIGRHASAWVEQRYANVLRDSPDRYPIPPASGHGV